MESRAELIITPILWHSYTAVALVCKDEVIPEQKKVARDLVDSFLALERIDPEDWHTLCRDLWHPAAEGYAHSL